jgi:hypothetical protein
MTQRGFTELLTTLRTDHDPKQHTTPERQPPTEGDADHIR